MKRNNIFCLLFLVSIGLFAQKNNPIVMTIDGENVTKSEFEKIYKKNSDQSARIDAKSLDEYINLFVNYKLKVREAEKLGYDTVTDFVKELEGYRKQLSQPYLMDNNVSNKIIEEAYERMKYDIRASHILILVNESASAKDTLAAYNKIMDIKKKIESGMEFNKAAFEFSQDPSAKGIPAQGNRPAIKANEGDLGYFTVFQMIYPFETAAYNTPIGQLSMPIRTKYGYHLIKVTDKRLARGEVQVAHIMLRVTDEMNEEQKGNVKAKIMEIHSRLEKGEDFANLAQLYSDDKNSGAKGGLLPWFGTGKMVPEFEDKSFSLTKIGEISAPFRTKYGYHIVKLIDKKEIGDYESLKNELKKRVDRDSRSLLPKYAAIEKLKNEYNFKSYPKAKNKLYEIVDSTILKGKWAPENDAKLNKKLFSFADKVYYQYDLSNYIVKNQVVTSKMPIKAYVDKLYDKFVEETIFNYENTQLDKKYPEFASLMKEYRDGILLFELTDDMVWSKAINDTIGLKAFYEANKSNYMWPKRVEASIYVCANETIAKELRAQFKKSNFDKNSLLSLLNKSSQLNLSVEEGKFAQGENIIIDKVKWEKGISENLKINNSVVIVVVNNVLPETPKSLNEARGIITSDYQNHLEKNWLNLLKSKYTVVLNKEVLDNIK